MEESSGGEQCTKSMTPRILIIEPCFLSSLYTRTFIHVLYSSSHSYFEPMEVVAVWRFEGGVAAAPAGVSVWIEPVIRNWNTPSTIFVSNHDLDEHKFSVLAFINLVQTLWSSVSCIYNTLIWIRVDKGPNRILPFRDLPSSFH